MGANLVKHKMNLCISLDVYFSFKTFSHKSHEYQHDLNENLFI